MNVVTKSLTAISLSLLLTACNDDSAGENFVGTWAGENNRGADFTYSIQKADSSFNVTRQMKDYSPDMYKGFAKDETTLKLGDGDTLIYRPDSDSIYARGDDVILSRASK